MLRALYRIWRIDAARGFWQVSVLSRGRFILAAKWLVSVFALWLVLRSLDFCAVMAAIGRATPLGLGLAAAVVVMQFVVLVWRWQFVLHILGSRAVGFGILSVMLGYSFLVGQVLPSSVGGDVARAVMLGRLTGVPIAARSVIFDRLLGFAGLTLLAALALPIAAGRVGGITPFLTLTTAVLGTMTAAAIVLIFPSFVYGWVGRQLGVVAADLRLGLCMGRTGLLSVVFGVASNLAGVLLIYVLALAIGTDLRALDCLVLVPPVLLVSALPISLAGWGVREGALVAAFSLVQADPASLVTISIMSGLTTPLIGWTVVVASVLAGWRDFLPKGGLVNGE